MRYRPLLWALLCLVAGAAQSADRDTLIRMMDAIAQRDYPLAREAARETRDQVALDLVTWHQLRAGQGSWADYTDFLRRNPDWPGLALMRRRAEAVMPTDLPTEAKQRFFRSGAPQTGRGALLLVSTQNTELAKRTVIGAWTEKRLTQAEQAAFLQAYGKVLKPHHATRLDNLLWEGHTKEAEAMLPLVGKDRAALAKARIALQLEKNGVDALIKAVPAKLQGDAGLAHDRFAWRMRKDRYDPSETLLKERSVSKEALGRPEAWAYRRRLLAHRAMRQGRVTTAYNLASQHFLTEGSSFAELEWLSGYIALTYLGKTERAVAHFERFRLAVETPISLGRAGYWLGRAYEAEGNSGAAKSAYGYGAAYQTSFYGQLAAERAKLPVDPLMAKSGGLPDWKSRPFARSTPVRAALLLREAGDHVLMQRFILHVQESLDVNDSLALAAMSIQIDRPFAAVKIAKRLARKGLVQPDAYYPIADTLRHRLPVDQALANAIARQESELNPYAISPAGARGLMQLMPATAKNVAKQIGVDYDRARLTQDPGYNSQLGTQYLADMLERYNGSIILAAVAYNAGPHRADRWIAEYGDPRAPEVDSLWWIENIPYGETRNYVMRVMESLHVYRMRISGKVTPIGLHKELGVSF
ncbi:lytic transglycosylase domain-containing protein [Halovulum sp. GXIMD14793]